MKLQIVKGSTSQIITVFIKDSRETDGSGLGSLDQTSSIVGGYVRTGETGLALAVDENVATEGTYEAPSTDNQIRIGTPANMTTGTYELHLHNDLLAAGADSVLITLGGAADMADLVIEIQLTDDLPKRLDRNADLIESQQDSHTWHGNEYYVDFPNGNDSTGDGSRVLPYKTLQAAHDDLITANNHDVIFLWPGTHTVAATTTLSKDYFSIRGRGRNSIITRTGSGDTIAITGNGIRISKAQIGTAATGSGHGVKVTGVDFARIDHCWLLDTQGDGVHLLRASNCKIHGNDFQGTGVGGSGQGIHIVGTGGSSNGNVIYGNEMHSTAGTAILIEQGTTNDTLIFGNDIHDAGGWGINIGGSSTRAVVYGNVLGNNSSGDITDSGSNSIIKYGLDVNATGEANTEDVYHADIDLSIDETNIQDEYTISWFKNGVRVTSGITVPKLQVVKRADGSDLIALDNMTQIGSIGSYKYDEGTNRITAGEAMVAVVTATIDASSRSFARVLSRDSSA